MNWFIIKNSKRFIKPRNLDEWIEYICFEHPIGRVITALIILILLWLFVVIFSQLDILLYGGAL